MPCLPGDVPSILRVAEVRRRRQVADRRTAGSVRSSKLPLNIVTDMVSSALSLTFGPGRFKSSPLQKSENKSIYPFVVNSSGIILCGHITEAMKQDAANKVGGILAAAV